MAKSFADILKEEEKSRQFKIQSKLPTWAATCNIDIPNSLNLEQCSSELAAVHKASLIAGRTASPRIADLTGGLGVDSWAFGKVAAAVLHNEMNAGLSAAVESNFEKLGASGNVIFTRHEIGLPDRDGWVEELERFKPDVIFMDPARRDAKGKKVFLLEDCSPDFINLRPVLQRICPHIVLKLSPMADISMLISRIGDKLGEIHIISIKGEVKELLCFLDDEIHDEPVITASEIHSGKEFSFTFTLSEEKHAHTAFCTELSEGSLLLEPSPALMKAGCFNLLSERLGLSKLSGSTHIYTGVPDADAGRMFRICRTVRILPLDSASIRTVSKEYPEADVTARDIPMTSDQLRAKLKVKPDNGIRIYGCRVGESRKLIVCSNI